MKLTGTLYLIILTAIVLVYYLVTGIYLNHLGYYNHESLFYIEKSKIVFEGLGGRLKVMGLTAPIIPFYANFVFTLINYKLAPVMASSVGMAILFYIMADTMAKKIRDEVYVWLVLALFLFHPGMLYAACSGKSIYLILIFFFLFFHNLFKYYRSHTTFHVSIASICLVMLIFCDYNFVWLTLFFFPLVLSITLNSLNLGEQESIFRLFMSFNSPSLRRKLINKTLALYIILFVLPLASVLSYKLLNLTHSGDMDYFRESPYATWTVLMDKLSVDSIITGSFGYKLPQLSILISAGVVLFCPMMVIAIYLFRQSTYQVLSILTPFALIEFLHIKYDNVFISYPYYLMFVVLAVLAVIFKLHTVKNHKAFKILLGITILVQIYTGWYFLSTSYIAEEQNFAKVLLERKPDELQDDNIEIADYLSSLPGEAHILIDDAIAYPIVAFTHDIKPLILPYQTNFISAVETPDKYAQYVVIATAKNNVAGYTQLNDKYMITAHQANSSVGFRKVYETTNWIVYRIIGSNTEN
jgi:hypothetical protein